MKQVSSLALLFFFFLGLNTGFSQKQKAPIVGGIETISFQFKESSIRFPTNYTITVEKGVLTINVEEYKESGIVNHTKSKKLSKKDLAKINSLAGNMQEMGEYYPEGGTGYKTYKLTRKNAGTIQAHELVWTSLTQDKADRSSLELAELLKSLAPSIEGVTLQ